MRIGSWLISLFSIRIAIALCLLLPAAAAAADLGEETGSDTAEKEEAAKKERPYVIAPMLVSSPSFGNGGGLTALYFYRPTADDDVSPPSTITAMGLYSDTGSYFAGLFNKMHLKEDRLRLTMGLAGGRLKNEYEIPELGTVTFSTHVKMVFARSEWGVGKNWFIGVQGGWGDGSYREGNELSGDFFELFGVEDTAGGMLGVLANHDTREHQRYPHGGSFSGITANILPEWLGSDEGYHVLEGETNHFVEVTQGQVLALRAAGRFTPDDTPYSGLSTLGRGNDLRGYTAGEKVAENLISAQAEYRWMFTRRWGVVGFAGVATLYDGGMGNIGGDTIYYSGGMGIRFRIHQENRVNFRVDYAIGENDQDGFYVGVGEAF